MSLNKVNQHILTAIQAALPAGTPAYLVGGAVRDLLLNRLTHDLDFVVPDKAIPISRSVANSLGGGFYALDPERDAGRVIITTEANERYFLDFASFRGVDLESDLRNRDFTINAMALNIREPETLIDPLGGARDLKIRHLRLCSPASFENDPLRILRGVRQATEFELRILPETRHRLRKALPGLVIISPERVRDELFRILDGQKPVVALRALDMLGALTYILPELDAMKGVTQPPPHHEDVWSHALSTVHRLANLIDMLQPEYKGGTVANWAMGLVSLRLGRYRQQLTTHLGDGLHPDRSQRALLLLAALYHDVAKPATRQVDQTGRIRFLEHDQLGADLAHQRGTSLHLSNAEIERLTTIVRHHMRPLLLAQSGEVPTRRAIYRFFRATGPAGVDICLLSLADSLATYGAGLPQEIWTTQLDVTRALLEAWWEQADEKVAPPVLLNGHDLIQAFNLSPGPEIGRILEQIREAQASGEIKERVEALAYARALLGIG
jgi:putative nucleotidyltransferase with HDIG domain